MDTNEGLLFLVWVLFGTGSIIGLTIYGLVHVL
jgi:hypothetical protein